MKKIKLFIIVIVMLFLTGCTRNYDLEPIYNHENKSISITGKIFNNVALVTSRNGIGNNTSFRFRTTNNQYLIKSDECENVHFRKMTSGHNASITDNFEIILKRDFTIRKNGKCDVIKFNNVKFMNCYTTEKPFRKIFAMTSEVDSSQGYGDVKSSILDNKCFLTMKNHYINLAQKDNTDIINYSHIIVNGNPVKTKEKIFIPNIEDSDSFSNRIYDGKYEGIFNDKGIEDNCAQHGRIFLKIKNNSYYGKINLKEENVEIHGNVINNTLNGNLKNGTFSGRIKMDSTAITGNYFLGSCYGSFILNKI